MHQRHAEWWPQVRIAVRAYKRRKRKRNLPPQQRREVKAVDEAIKWLKKQEDGRVQWRMIQLYQIRQTHELRGAAEEVGYSYSAAVLKNREFMRQVAINLGYEFRTEDEERAGAWDNQEN